MTIRWKYTPILVTNLACEKTQYVVLQSVDGVRTYCLVFGGMFWYIFSLELSGVQHWDDWLQNYFNQRKWGV